MIARDAQFRTVEEYDHPPIWPLASTRRKPMPDTVKARISTQILCPSCGWYLRPETDYLLCENGTCLLFYRKYKLPEIELEIIPDFPENSDAENQTTPK